MIKGRFKSQTAAAQLFAVMAYAITVTASFTTAFKRK